MVRVFLFRGVLITIVPTRIPVYIEAQKVHPIFMGSTTFFVEMPAIVKNLNVKIPSFSCPFWTGKKDQKTSWPGIFFRPNLQECYLPCRSSKGPRWCACGFGCECDVEKVKLSFDQRLTLHSQPSAIYCLQSLPFNSLPLFGNEKSSKGHTKTLLLNNSSQLYETRLGIILRGVSLFLKMN